MTTEHYDDPMAHNVLETTRQAVESNDLSIERPAARKNAGIKRTSRVSLYVRRLYASSFCGGGLRATSGSYFVGDVWPFRHAI